MYLEGWTVDKNVVDCNKLCKAMQNAAVHVKFGSPVCEGATGEGTWAVTGRGRVYRNNHI